jgi:hypothetical protein
MRATCSAHLILLDLICLIIPGQNTVIPYHHIPQFRRNKEFKMAVTMLHAARPRKDFSPTLSERLALLQCEF